LHQVSDQRIGFRDRLTGLVDEACLDFLPAAREALALISGEEGLMIGVGAGDVLPNVASTRVEVLATIVGWVNSAAGGLSI
jgi:hypothetical protein